MKIDQFNEMLNFIPHTQSIIVQSDSNTDKIIDHLRKRYTNHKEINMDNFNELEDVLDFVKSYKNIRSTIVFNNMDENKFMNRELIRYIHRYRDEFLNEYSRMIFLFKKVEIEEYITDTYDFINAFVIHVEC